MRVLRPVVVTAFLAYVFPAVFVASPVTANPDLPGQLKIVVGTGAGGGFDQYARLLAKHMETSMASKPTVVVQNMPGAGGIRALSWLASKAPADGSTVATMSGAAVFAPLTGQRGATYDAKAFNYLISLDRLDNFLIVWHTTPHTSAKDAFDREIIIANSSGPSAVMPTIYNSLLGTKFKVVKGYRGTNEVLLALERGEGEGAFNLSWSSIVTHPRLLDEKLVRILLQLTFKPVDDPRLAGVPTLNDFVKDEAKRDMLEILLAKDELGRALIAPQGTPDKAVKAWRDELMRIVRDPAFLADAAQRKMPLSIKPGAEVQEYVTRIYAKPAATVAQVRDLLDKASAQIEKTKN